MREKQKLLPKLRFPEFREAGEWEEKLIEDFFVVGSSKRVLQQDWTTQGVPFYRTRELVSLSKNEPFGSEIFISEELFSEISEKYGLPAEGDFLVSGVGTLGISYQVQAQDRFYFKDGNVLWFKLKGGIVSTFFKYCFEADEIQNQILGQASISTVGTYTIQNAKVTKFPCPSKIEEQQKNADFLASLDELIILEAQQLDTLKTHKKGLMQQLFPAEGETLPKLRFPEFRDAGEWENKKLSSLIQLISGLHLSPDQYSNSGTTPYFTGPSDFTNEIQTVSKWTEESTSIARENDILITVKGSGVGEIFFLALQSVAMGRQLMAIRSKKGSNRFIYQFLLTKRTRFGDLASGNLIPGLSRGDILDLEAHFPSLPEQQKIAECLASLDDLITAQTQKLAALKTHKKGLMQQLFPALVELDQNSTVKDSLTVRNQTDHEATTEEYSAVHRGKRDKK